MSDFRGVTTCTADARRLLSAQSSELIDFRLQLGDAFELHVLIVPDVVHQLAE